MLRKFQPPSTRGASIKLDGFAMCNPICQAHCTYKSQHQFQELRRQRCFTLTQCQSVSTFESEVQNSLSALEPCSMDSLIPGPPAQHKKLSPKITLHFKVLRESKSTLPILLNQILLKYLVHLYIGLHQVTLQ